MKILSCFDGMSCGQIALERVGIKIDKYYASEIDKNAIQVTMKNYPNTIQLGTIINWKNWNIESPDLIIGGSPCQGFSFAGKQLNFNDERSKLFFTFIEILKHYKPKYFLLENVVMKTEHNDVISAILGELYPESITQTEFFRIGRLEPILINSNLVSAQNRERLYWTNIPNVILPKNKGILLKDIIDFENIGILTDDYILHRQSINRFGNHFGTLATPKHSTICAIGKSDVLLLTDLKRFITPKECERLQTVPDNYTNCVSSSHRYEMLGNGWTVDVIAHIMKNILEV